MTPQGAGTDNPSLYTREALVFRACGRGRRIPTGASRREASTLGVRPRNDTVLAGVRENALIKPLDFVQNHDFSAVCQE